MDYVIQMQAADDFRRLIQEFHSVKGSDNSIERFRQLAMHFHAHTVEDDFMDFNYGRLTATVYRDDGIITLSEMVEVWDELAFLGNYSLEDLAGRTHPGHSADKEDAAPFVY